MHEHLSVGLAGIVLGASPRAGGARRPLRCGAALLELRCLRDELSRGRADHRLRDGVARADSRSDRSLCPHAGTLQAVSRLLAGPERPERDLSWISDDLEVAEEGEVALFVGCLPFFDVYFEGLGVHTLDSARAAIRILNRLGIRPVVAADERCCGHDLLWAGDRATFTTLAEANVETYRSRGVKHLITTCAECCRTWRRDVHAAVSGPLPQVEHLAEYLADRIDSGGVRFDGNGPATLTYQDPCRLGRHLGVVDAPRRVLNELPGIEMAEMRHAGHDATCCGTSGFTHCDADSQKPAGAPARRSGRDRSGHPRDRVSEMPHSLLVRPSREPPAGHGGDPDRDQGLHRLGRRPAVGPRRTRGNHSRGGRGIRRRRVMIQHSLRVGVFVCDCGLNIAGFVDTEEVARYAESLPDVVAVVRNRYTCADPGQNEIKKAIAEHKLDRVVIASCTPKIHEPTFRTCVDEAGLNPYLVEMANIREHCSWVHMHEKDAATGKAKDLVRSAVERARRLQSQDEKSFPVTDAALVIGGGVAGMQAALELAEGGHQVYLVSASRASAARWPRSTRPIRRWTAPYEFSDPR